MSELKVGPVIGVFDSGFGGLTVLKALLRRIPNARFVFLGDTARLPYGSKSRRTIARYASESARFLVEQQGAEFLVIACNTASALALDAIKEAVPVPVLGVIDPGAAAAAASSGRRDVMVIATEATVASHAYAAACEARGLRAVEKACPLLVPLVEEGWVDHPVTAEVIRIYLNELLEEAGRAGRAPDTLVLGCTHYPLLRPVFERVLCELTGPGAVRVIDSAEATAAEAASQVSEARPGAPAFAQVSEARPGAPAFASLVSESRPGAPTLSQVSGARPGAPALPEDAETPRIACFATDSVEKFERLGSRFLGLPVGPVSLVDLGG